MSTPDMPFLQAGFNARNRDTGIRGWTRHIAGRHFAPAELRQFGSGDYFWLGERPGKGKFIAWGDNVVLGSRREFVQTWPDELPHSVLPLDGKRKAPPKIAFTILGEPKSKENSRELVMMNRLSRKSGRMVKMPALIKSDEAREYERSALLQIPPSARVRFEGDVRLTARIFYASRRPDLSATLIRDILQDRFVFQGEGEKRQRIRVQRGVYANDRQVKEEHYYHGLDPANPRAEIEVELMFPEQQGDLLEA